MRTATIQGHVTATVKHPSFEGQRLLIAVPESADVPPQIVVDPLGAALGARVLISSDGSEARAWVRDDNSPARWVVCGILDATNEEEASAMTQQSATTQQRGADNPVCPDPPAKLTPFSTAQTRLSAPLSGGAPSASGS